jgi:hypothetical protein
MSLPERAGLRAASGRTDRRAIASQRRVFEVLVDPENDERTELEKAALAGMAPRTWRKHRTPEVVYEALCARRAAYVQHLPEIDAALLRKAKEGSLPHMLIAYERIEGWRPGLVLEADDDQIVRSELWEALGEDGRRMLAEFLGQCIRAHRSGSSDPRPVQTIQGAIAEAGGPSTSS